MKQQWKKWYTVVLAVGVFALASCSSKEQSQDEALMSTDDSAAVDSSSASSSPSDTNLGASSTGMGR